MPQSAVEWIRFRLNDGQLEVPSARNEHGMDLSKALTSISDEGCPF